MVNLINLHTFIIPSLLMGYTTLITLNTLHHPREAGLRDRNDREIEHDNKTVR